MSLVHRCQVSGCRTLASTVIGHVSKQVHMCPTCATTFRVASVQAQRHMLATARPPDTFNAGRRYSSAGLTQ